MVEEKSILKSDNMPETDSTQNGTAGKAISNYDIVIVGAGIAGSSTAIALAPEGYNILLVDKAVFPRQKTCGECIMPEGVQRW